MMDLAYLFLVLICILMLLYQNIKAQNTIENFKQEREQWAKERKDLLDRIQAPTFNEYASKVIREKKAEQPEEPQEEIEFVS